MSTPAESETAPPSPTPLHPQSHLRNAAEHLGQARESLTDGVADAVSSSKNAAREARAELDDKLEKLIDQGKDMFDQAEDLIRSRPWVSFGAAFAAGYLLAKLSRRS